MHISFVVSDNYAEKLGNGADLGRRAFELLVMEWFRAGQMTMADFRDLLGFTTQEQANEFLVNNGFTLQADGLAPGELLKRFREFREGNTLDGLDPVALTREGRRY